MSLVDFPTELLVQVVSCLEYASDLCAFSQTHPRFHPLVQSSLEQFLQKESPRHALLHAAKKGNGAAVRRLLKLGALFPEHFSPNLMQAPGDPMALAAKNGHADVVKILLEHGQDPCVVSGWYEDKEEDTFPSSRSEATTRAICENPIMLAARKGHESVLKLFKDHVPKKAYLDVDVGTARLQTWEDPLVWATFKLNIPIMKLLLEYDPESANKCSSRGSTPFHALASASPTSARFDEAFELLIHHGALSWYLRCYERLFRYAIERKNTRFIELSCNYLKLNMQQPFDTAWLLKMFEEAARTCPEMAAVFLSYIDTEQAMLFNDEARAMLFAGAAAGGFEDLLRRLFETYRSFPPREDSYLPLMGLGILSGKVEILKILLANGFDIIIGPMSSPRPPRPIDRYGREIVLSPKQNIPIITALLNRHHELVDFLVESGVDGPLAEREGPQLLFDLALGLGYSDLAQKLFDRGTAPPMEDIAFEDQGNSIIMAIAGGEDSFETLLGNGLTLDPYSQLHVNAFLWVASQANVPFLEKFLDAGFKADMEQLEFDHSCVSLHHEDGLTLPLLYAAHATDRAKAEAAVDLLLKRGASINQPTGMGSCSALYATASGSILLAMEPLVNRVEYILRDCTEDKHTSLRREAPDPAYRRHLGVQALQLLLNKGANPLFWNQHGRSPLCIATVSNDMEMVQALLSSFDQQDVPFSAIEPHLRLAASIRTMHPRARYRYNPKVSSRRRLERDLELENLEEDLKERMIEENLGNFGGEEEEEEEEEVDDNDGEQDENEGEDSSEEDEDGVAWVDDESWRDFDEMEDELTAEIEERAFAEMDMYAVIEEARLGEPRDIEKRRREAQREQKRQLRINRDTERLIWRYYWRHVYPPPA
ncbi:unnamed protein product [Penicillium olsonii]|uniref:Ankyrin n=1 Tax=Penicillium olsonii TaxID=99116 RepID=A0A9W4HE93_PENOL|nr:unnamed protein product [Penicillium olsonii]